MRPFPVRVRLTAWYLAVVGLMFALSAVGMYFGMRAAIEHSVDRALRNRVDEMRQFLWRHRRIANSDMPEHFRQSSEIQPGEELFQVADSSGAWLYRAPLMAALQLPGGIPDPNRGSSYQTILARRSSIRVLSSTVEVSGKQFFVQVGTVVGPSYGALGSFAFVALCTLPLVLLAAGAGGYWLSGRAMKPVHDIARAAQGISERNLSQRLTIPPADDELRHLSETLNGMLTRLDAAFTRITRFTADASHELRTPLAVIRTTSELILDHPRSIQEYEEMVGQILTESEYSSELIEKLLTLARADMNPASLELSPVDGRQLIEDVAPGCRSLAMAHGLTFSSRIDPAGVLVLAEKQALKRLLLILIDNAVKYSRPGGAVQLSLACSSTQAVFEVKDSGIGIPQGELPHVFERFFRASNARDSGVAGTGLGLAIANWIAQAHHGKLDVRSVPGEGTVFRLLLPLHNGGANGRMHDTE